MTAVQHHASLHEKAVQAVATDDLSLPPRSRKAPRKYHLQEVTSVPQLALDMARVLADGDMSRVVLERDGSVLVVNHRGCKG